MQSIVTPELTPGITECAGERSTLCFEIGTQSERHPWSKILGVSVVPQNELCKQTLYSSKVNVFGKNTFSDSIQSTTMKTEPALTAKPAPAGQESSPTPKQPSPKLSFIEFWPQCLNPEEATFEERSFERFE